MVPSPNVNRVVVADELVKIRVQISLKTPVAPAAIKDVEPVEAVIVIFATPTRSLGAPATVMSRPALSAISPTRLPFDAAVGYEVVAIPPP